MSQYETNKPQIQCITIVLTTKNTHPYITITSYGLKLEILDEINIYIYLSRYLSV